MRLRNSFLIATQDADSTLRYPGEMENLDSDGRSFTFVELFAGIGGFNLGLRAAGGINVFASEWDKFAVSTYKNWYPEVPMVTGDVRDLDFETDIPSHDVLVGGFPCQPFSLAGVSKKNSLGRPHGFEDRGQGNLFFSIAEIAVAKRPKIIFLENVKNLLSHDGGKTWARIQEIFGQIDYRITYAVINAKAWVPQSRERVYIVAFDNHRYKSEKVADFEFPDSKLQQAPVLSSILETEHLEELELSPKLWEFLQEYSQKHKSLGNGFGYQIADKAGVTRTLSARYHKDGSEILVREDSLERPRRLSVNEAKRLMGFNAEFERHLSHDRGFETVVSKTQAYKQLGNAVVPKVILEIAKNFRSYL